MKREEIAKLFMLIKGNYPLAYRDFDEVLANITISSWQNLLHDMPANVIFTVVQKYINNPSNSKFPPHISEIREEAVKLINPHAESFITGEEAWEMVLGAVKKYGFYQKDLAFKTLTDPIKRAVNMIGYENICMSEKIGIERANFLKFYDSIEKDSKEKFLLPEGLLRKIQEITEQHKAKELADGKE